MHYFVTGGTGFIGGQVIRQLAAAGHQVTALVRHPDRARDLEVLGVRLVLGDITKRACLAAPMTGVDGVFHLAAWYKVGAKDHSRARAINVEGTRNVLETALELGIPRTVYTSTLAINSDTHGKVVDESYRYTGKHLSEYDATKWAADYTIAQPLQTRGLPLIVVLPGVTYGPGDTSAAHTLLHQYVGKKLGAVPVESAATWGHVVDTARGHLLAMEKGRIGERYIIAGYPITILKLLELAYSITRIPVPKNRLSPTMLKMLGAGTGVLGRFIDLPPELHPETLRVLAGATYLGSNAKAIKELGLTHRPLKDGLAETLGWERAHLVGAA